MRRGCWQLEDPWAATLRRTAEADGEEARLITRWSTSGTSAQKGGMARRQPRDSWSVVMQQQAGDGGRLALRVVDLGIGDSANQDAEPELRSSGNPQWKHGASAAAHTWNGPAGPRGDDADKLRIKAERLPKHRGA